MNQVQNVTRSKLWTKNYNIMMVVSFILSISMTMTMATLPLYAQHIGGSTSTAGLVIGVFSFSALLFRPVVGNLLDSRGRKMVLIAGIIIFSLSQLSYVFAYTVGILLVLRFFHGIGFSAQSTSVGTIFSDITPADRLGEGIGYSATAGIIATAIGPALGLYLVGHSSYNMLFAAATFMGGISFLGGLLVNYEQKGKKQTLSTLNQQENGMILTEQESIKKPGKGGFFEKTSIPPAIVGFLVILTYGGVFTFVPSYALSLGIESAGAFFTVFSIAFLLVRPITGKLSDRYGVSLAILPGMAITFLAMMVLAFAASLPAFLVAGALYGLGYGAVQPTLNAVTFMFCPAERRGAANATYLSAMDIGMTLGPIVWGIVSQTAGFPYVYISSAVCVAIALVVYIFILHGRVSKNSSVQICDSTADA